MTKMKVMFVSFAVLSAFFTSCAVSPSSNSSSSSSTAQSSSASSSVSTATVSGTITLPAAQDGKLYTIMIADNVDSSLAVYKNFAFGACSSDNTITYSFANVPYGNYCIMATVNVDETTSTIGDYMGFFGGMPPTLSAVVDNAAETFDFSLYVSTW